MCIKRYFSIILSHYFFNFIRWVDERPGRDWIRNFQKRSADVRAFFDRLTPNLEGIPATHVFNYDETNFRDNHGVEEAFFGGSCKYYEQAGYLF